MYVRGLELALRVITTVNVITIGFLHVVADDIDICFRILHIIGAIVQNSERCVHVFTLNTAPNTRPAMQERDIQENTLTRISQFQHEDVYTYNLKSS